MPETLSTATPPRSRAGRKPFLFLVLEAARPAALGARYALAGVDHVILGRGERRAALRRDDAVGRALVVEVPDRRMSTVHARLVSLAGGWALEDAASKNGTRVNGAPERRRALADGDLLELGETFFVFRELAATAHDLDGADLVAPARGLATLLPDVEAGFERLARVAASEVPVVVRGESGAGKELIARAVHALSRRAGPFVAVNCGAIPSGLIESELFGHRKGAFSGALEDRAGLVRTAHGGTLFLDEIGDLALPSQAALLRVLQENEVTPVGEARPVSVDLRVVAATHRDLDGMVARGKFRQDLLARVSGFAFDLPPLRERREDLGLIAGRLVRDGTTLSPEAARLLIDHDWPLNVRELEQGLGAAAALAGAGGRILPEHLPSPVREGTSGPEAPLDAEQQRLKDELSQRLREHAGNVSAVARAMGKDRTQIRRWMRRFGLG
jgi:transcriptional regulator with PAS, ATPase and Fis domain